MVLNEQGEKLSKQTFAAPVDRANPLSALRHALELLGQTPPDRGIATLADFWRWATQSWSLNTLTPQPSVNLVANINNIYPIGWEFLRTTLLPNEDKGK